MGYTTPPTFVAGNVLTAAQLNTFLRDNFKAIGEPFSSWTPTYGNITPGNAGVSAKYLQIGKLVIGYFYLDAGSTTTYSAGTLTISMPVAPAVTLDAVVYGSGLVYNNSGSSTYPVAVTSSGGVFRMRLNGGAVTNAFPFTFGTSSDIGFFFVYEAA